MGESMHSLLIKNEIGYRGLRNIYHFLAILTGAEYVCLKNSEFTNYLAAGTSKL